MVMIGSAPESAEVVEEWRSNIHLNQILSGVASLVETNRYFDFHVTIFKKSAQTQSKIDAYSIYRLQLPLFSRAPDAFDGRI